MDSLDKFKNEYQPQANFENQNQMHSQPQANYNNQNQMYQEKFEPYELKKNQIYERNYEQFEESKPINKSNELSKNFANFYGVTPPRTG